MIDLLFKYQRMKQGFEDLGNLLYICFIFTFFVRREFHLPDEAITGLRQALIASKRTPKQIQHEADELNERLNQRR